MTWSKSQHDQGCPAHNKLFKWTLGLCGPITLVLTSWIFNQVYTLHSEVGEVKVEVGAVQHGVQSLSDRLNAEVMRPMQAQSSPLPDKVVSK